MGSYIKDSQLLGLLGALREQKKTIVTTNGCFDVLHVGHIRYLQKSRSFGDVLIVLLNSDASVKRLKGEDRPINPEDERAEVLCALSCVDYVVLFETDTPVEVLDIIKPNIHTKGGDYDLSTLPESDVILQNNGFVQFIDFVEGKSSTNIINNMK